VIQVGAKDVSLEDEFGELAFANDFYQTGRLQFFHVVGESGGTDAMVLLQVGAGHRIGASADFLDYLVTSRFGQGTGYTRELLIGEATVFVASHLFKVRPTRFWCLEGQRFRRP
jgi:hypothetical protein